MIQDIYPHILHNQYDPSRKASSRSIVLVFREGDVLIRGGSFPCVKDLAGISENDLIYLFSIDDDKDYFLLPGEAEAPEGHSGTGNSQKDIQHSQLTPPPTLQAGTETTGSAEDAADRRARTIRSAHCAANAAMLSIRRSPLQSS